MQEQRFQVLVRAFSRASQEHRLSRTPLNMTDYSVRGLGAGLGGTESPQRVSQYFGINAFTLAHMRERLPKEAYRDLLKALDQNKKISFETAEAIAVIVKDWAVQRGATHFCHWFQPLTGLTAEKHDAFISIQHTHHSETYVIEGFTGTQLIQGEPDASSFPSGGMRSTFEARGYTAWDPSSPFFILEDGRTKTLCIPSVFVGYHGQSLDMKTPLLRSIEELSKAACEFLKLLGDVDVKRVTCTLGAEQEYFLIDENFYLARPDLYMTGRSLLGAPSPRGQQFEDHYFGAIPSRVKNFMADLEWELYKLGIPVKTRHNEVAPSQFEVAPIFEDLNVAVDHNLLTMEALRRVARRHGLVCLLHEKPFAGINGSGKHCNWSMANDKGENLLEPGHTPHQNIRFLAVLSVVLQGVYDHADLLRYSVASSGNDHRLGANEAPPAIVSVFLGSLLENILDAVEKNQALKATAKEIIDLGISRIPNISKDYTDRNRTSPFAFTGNKFEFRAVGSSANPSYPMMVLNAAVADSFLKATEVLKTYLKSDVARDEAVLQMVRKLLAHSRPIRFSGNGYSEEWRKEAKERGLPIAPYTLDALQFLKDSRRTEFLVKTKILSQDEINSHYQIFTEKYLKSVELEVRVLLEMVQTQVLPVLEKMLIQKRQLISVFETLRDGTVSEGHRDQATLVDFYQKIRRLVEQLGTHLSEIHHIPHQELSVFVETKIMSPMRELRGFCDRLESLAPDELWPIPKYREIILTLPSS
ncbi:MAG: glutamine synthetase III [Bdellovibrionaceae bacterium]|nr:glutamine synthetase III [Pseudobdellovibrionaceae bacterium]MDW8190795.1 glutamine synthetase III [Pseudobdellovibrionaceae bacterium]